MGQQPFLIPIGTQGNRYFVELDDAGAQPVLYLRSFDTPYPPICLTRKLLHGDQLLYQHDADHGHRRRHVYLRTDGVYAQFALILCQQDIVRPVPYDFEVAPDISSGLICLLATERCVSLPRKPAEVL